MSEVNTDPHRAGYVYQPTFTEGDAAKKQRAASIFKAHHSEEVLYWGEWTLERL